MTTDVANFTKVRDYDHFMELIKQPAPNGDLYPKEFIVQLNFGANSSHRFMSEEEDKDGNTTKIYHHSWVDDSEEYLTPEEFKNGFYHEAITKGAFYLENQ